MITPQQRARRVKVPLKMNHDDGVLRFPLLCQKCGTTFSKITASCGTGWSWELYKCPNCEQLYAEPSGLGGFIPPSVLADSEIVVLSHDNA